MRLFVALNLPPEESEAIYAATAPLRGAGVPVRWTRPESIHLTLKFLGAVPAGDVEEVIRAMVRGVEGGGPIDLRIGGFGAFPSIGRPRVIWMGVDGGALLLELKANLEKAFEAIGFEREDRPFQPHLTLGRARSGTGPGDFRAFGSIIERISFRSTVRVNEVDLMRSQLSPGGPRYERIATAALG